MNPVLILTRNCLELTKCCVESARKQDVPTDVFVFDNGSKDGTADWLVKQGFGGMTHPDNKGVSYGWNLGLSFHFEGENNHVLVLNNDTMLPPWFYSELLSYDLPFVSGVSVGNMEQIAERPTKSPLRPHPDFSAFLIRRDAWEKVGPFDESMKHYASDLDWHIRAHRKGIRLYGANLPFYHERSSTLKLATPEERQEIETQANNDRARLKEKWGVFDWGSEYDRMFDDSLFGVDALQAGGEKARS